MASPTSIASFQKSSCETKQSGTHKNSPKLVAKSYVLHTKRGFKECAGLGVWGVFNPDYSVKTVPSCRKSWSIFCIYTFSRHSVIKSHSQSIVCPLYSSPSFSNLTQKSQRWVSQTSRFRQKLLHTKCLFTYPTTATANEAEFNLEGPVKEILSGKQLFTRLLNRCQLNTLARHSYWDRQWILL